MNWQERTKNLIGVSNIEKLAQSTVAVVGVGGVGSSAMEMLCRAGVGRLILIDGETVDPTNINRQLIATSTCVGQKKVEVAKQRCLAINPEVKISVIDKFIGTEDDDKAIFDNCDYVIDAIDSVPAKIALICYCLKKGINIISSMGAAGRTDPSKIAYADISKTHSCALARTVRERLRHYGINKGLPTVFSDEKAVSLGMRNADGSKAFGTISYLPVVFGCYAAAWVLQSLCGLIENEKTQ